MYMYNMHAYIMCVPRFPHQLVLCTSQYYGIHVVVMKLCFFLEACGGVLIVCNSPPIEVATLEATLEVVLAQRHIELVAILTFFLP